MQIKDEVISVFLSFKWQQRRDSWRKKKCKLVSELWAAGRKPSRLQLSCSLKMDGGKPVRWRNSRGIYRDFQPPNPVFSFIQEYVRVYHCNHKVNRSYKTHLLMWFYDYWYHVTWLGGVQTGGRGPAGGHGVDTASYLNFLHMDLK